MSSSTYKNLLFDFGNVIIDIDIPGTHERFNTFFREDAHRDRIDHILEEYECGRVSNETFLNTLLSQSHRHIQALDILEAWNGMLIGIPEYRFTMLTALRKKYNVYLLSNTNEYHIEWVHRYLERVFGIRDFERHFFDGVYYSHLIGDRKPNPSIFEHVMSDALITPALTLFVDDNEDNIRTAQKLGFGTYHIDPAEEIAEYLKVEGYY